MSSRTLRGLLRGLVISGLLICLLFTAQTTAAVTPRELEQEQPDGPAAPSVALPDLIVDKITVSPPNPGPGSTADIEVTIKNVGDAPVTDFGVHLYVESPDNPPTLTTPYTTRTFYGLDPIGPGQSWSFARLGHTFSQSNPRIYAWVDRDNQVVESNETNNLFPSPPPSQADQYDVAGDDTCAIAQPIAVNGPAQEHNLFREGGSADQDWVKFDVQAGVIYVASAIAMGADANLVIESDTSCEGLPGLGGGQTITVTALANGTWYLKIVNATEPYGPDNAYRLQVKSDERCIRYEPNNQCAIATDMYAGDSALNNTFCTVDDVDWFRFKVDAGVSYTVTAANVGPGADVAVNLFEGCDGKEVGGNTLQLPYNAAREGYVYVRAQNKNAANYGTNTEYSLAVAADGTGRCKEDRYEQGPNQDDQLRDAQPLSVDGPAQEHNSCPAGDADWVKFTAAAGKTYSVETFGLAPKADTRICLYAANGTELGCDDDSGAGLGSRLVLTGAAADYYISIKDVDADVAGSETQYRIQVNAGPCRADEFEPDNGLTSARAIAADNALQTHTICGPGDVDWVAFSAAANTPYVLETVDLAAEADTVITLYDAAGTLLAANDDYLPGISSQLPYTFPTAGKYYARVQLYNDTNYGEGSRYGLRLRPGGPSSPPAPGNPPQNQPPGTPPAGSIRTLILVNPPRLAQLYNDPAQNQQLLDKLAVLARHSAVQGQIVNLNDFPDVRAAYAAWTADASSLASAGKANQVADAIRRVILWYRAQYSGLQYLVLVGDDRALPFYRIPDKVVGNESEDKYQDVNTLHPTGAALHSAYYLSDDFFAAGQPKISPGGRAMYVPDLAAGRLIEQPGDMVQFIDRFLANPVPPVNSVLVTGWTFVADVAQENCAVWRATLQSSEKVSCDLIGDGWTQQAFRAARFRTNPVAAIQSINGHEAHFGDQTPDRAVMNATEVAAAAVDLAGGLIYTPGCHGGLNVPPENSGASSDGGRTYLSLDLAEAFFGKGANYVGNTGYGYGADTGIILSEKLVLYYSQELANASYGKALTAAKQRFYASLTVEPTPMEQKVSQEMVLYGLPMYHEVPPGLGAPADPFPNVSFALSEPSLGPGDGPSVRTGQIDFRNGSFQLLDTATGKYLTLNGQSSAAPGHPMLPLYFKGLPSSAFPVRSVVLRDAAFVTSPATDPVVVTPVNEYSQDRAEWPLQSGWGWFPSVPPRIQTVDSTSTLATTVAQYNQATQLQRQFTTMQVDVYFSDSSDVTPPDILVVDAQVAGGGKANVKVGATDASGIHGVILSYEQGPQIGDGAYVSQELLYDPRAQKWVGSFPGGKDTHYFVQVVDKAGNRSVADNKGHYYTPAVNASVSVGGRMFLPLITH